MRVTGLLLVAALAGAAAGVVLADRLLDQPEDPPVPADSGAGVRAQGRLAEILLREAGLSRRSEPVELPVAELNALLARHVEARRLPVRTLRVAAGPGWLDAAGGVPVGRLLEAVGAGGWLATLPQGLQRREVWVRVRGRIEIDRGEARFLVDRAAIGRQPVPPGWVWALARVDPAKSLRWRMPSVVAEIRAEPGRLLILTRAQRRPLARTKPSRSAERASSRNADSSGVRLPSVLALSMARRSIVNRACSRSGCRWPVTGSGAPRWTSASL